jgi:O-antigen ligase
MKRGAILCGVICLVWFMVTNLRKVPRKRKWIVVLVTVAVVVAGVYFFNYMMETSSYFRYRLAATEAGESSGRNDLYSTFYNHFIHEDNPWKFLFGNGASATLKISYNFAHNDWLEIAINQGVVGLVIYLIYWVCYFITWRKTKQQPQAFMAIGMIFINYFLSTLFSMSYDSVSRCAAMVLGYYLAVYDSTEESLQCISN